MKIAKLPDRTTVKITFAASPSLAKDLALYAQHYEEVYRKAESISELIPYVLEAFLESDRGFMKFRRGRENGATTGADRSLNTDAPRSLSSSESASTSS